MSTGLKANPDGSAAIQVGGTDVITLTSGGAATFVTSPTTLAGNLTFSGTGNRITGDFSNATVANRVAFQTSTTNSNTALATIPNGTASFSGCQFFNNTTPDNAAYLQVGASSTAAGIVSGAFGTGTYLLMTFYTGGSERLRIGTSGTIDMAATASLQKNSTNAYTLKNTVLLTSGTGATYTTPTGVRALKVIALAGGGGGGGQDGQGAGTYTTAGPGRGGNAVSMFIPTASASYTYTIGAGGAAGAAGNNAGATGGNTTFGDGTLLITAGGGGGGNGVLGSAASSGINNA